MISNYSKTMELVNAANNSAGASQEQYEKTLDSVRMKLTKLKNAWNEFTMSLSNNEFIKYAVDALTGLLTTINKIIGALSGGNGIIKSTLGILTLVGGLKLGKSLVGAIGEKVAGGREGGLLQKIFGKKPQLQAEGMQAGQAAGQGFKAGFQAAIKGAKSGGLKGFFTREYSRDFTQAELEKTFENSKLDFSGANKDKIKDILYQKVQTKANEDFSFRLTDEQRAAIDEGDIEKLSRLGIEAKLTGQQMQECGIKVKATSINFSAVATAVGVASGALMGLASWLKTTGEGGEKARKGGGVNGNIHACAHGNIA